MKINQSTVPILNPLRTQKSQTSPKIDRRSPKSSISHSLSKSAESEPKSRTSIPSPTCKKDNKPNLNFTPPNPFVPNLASPNLAPNQFLYPNFASYDPRVINNLHHNYHNIPLGLSMLYASQPRLHHYGLMSGLGLELAAAAGKNARHPVTSPPPSPSRPPRSEPSVVRGDSFNGTNNSKNNNNNNEDNKANKKATEVGKEAKPEKVAEKAQEKEVKKGEAMSDTSNKKLEQADKTEATDSNNSKRADEVMKSEAMKVTDDVKTKEIIVISNDEKNKNKEGKASKEGDATNNKTA